MSLEAAKYFEPVDYDQLWRHDERLRTGMPATLRPVGPDGSKVELCHAPSSSNIYKAVKAAGQPLFPNIQEHVAALEGLRRAKSYLESIDELDSAVATDRLIDGMNDIRRHAVETKADRLNIALRRNDRYWVVFKAGSIGCFYAGKLTAIETVGADLDPLSLPILRGADDVPGRMPAEAQSFALYREAIDDAALSQLESRSV